MRVLGIDPGTATTGLGLIAEDHPGQYSVLDVRVITTPAGLPAPERLIQIYQQIQDYILLHQPEAAAVEKLFFQRNVTSAFAVGQARGVVILALAQAGVPIFEYTPLEVKQAVTGYGAADKKQVQQMVKILLNLEFTPKPDDAADALAIAICHAGAARWKVEGA